MELNLTKPGDPVKKLSLSLVKATRFIVELYWDSKHDLDAHALLAANSGQGAKVSSFGQVLSTYNAKKTNPQGVLESNPDGSFSTPCGSLKHSGDSRTGENSDIDEVIMIDGAKVPAEANEVPIFVTIHPSNSARFSEVKKAGIRIKDDSGKVLGEYELSKDFGQFDAVQMGSILHGPNGWEYAPVGVGFKGNFNAILENFS